MPIRDTVVILLVVSLLAIALRRPVVGAYAWAWLSLMNPHKLTYDFARTSSFALAAAVITVLGLLLTRKRQKFPLSGIVVVQLLLLAWMSITCLFAMAEPDFVLSRWIFVMKIHAMLLVTWMLVVDPKQLRTLIWVVTLSVAFFGIKGGIWTIATGGGGVVWGPPGGMLEDNNALAVALVMLLPMLYFLRQTSTNSAIRCLLLLSMVAVAFSILGSQSRGAFLALIAMAFFLGLKGRHPIRTSILLALVVSAAVAFMPDSWTYRMDTIRTYEADGSAMSRIYAWRTFWNAALDHPVVGVGFGADNIAVFAKYAPAESAFDAFEGRVLVAHSIYVQILGEHGFVGLALFIILGLVTWRTAGRIAQRTARDEELASWMPMLMRMVQVSLVGYAVGGLFLSLAYVDLPYYIMGFVVSAGMLSRQRTESSLGVTVPRDEPMAVPAHLPSK